MTVITKPNTILKKVQLIQDAEAAAAAAAAAKTDNAVIYVEDESDEPCWPFTRPVDLRHTVRAAAVVTVVLLAVMAAVAIYHRCTVTTHRYRAFCAVPVPKVQANGEPGPPITSTYHQVPALRWSSGPAPEVQVFSTMDEAATSELVNYLRESLDIQDDVEKITVFDNGKRVNFIHDFTENITSIIDLDRCFSMELDAEYVISPEVFTLSIERGDSLDTSVVRSVWRAMLPPLQQLASWAKPLCKDKPAYKLQREAVVIRKRSADEPPQEYMHFAGHHVLAIAIDNLAEILDAENKLNHTN